MIADRPPERYRYRYMARRVDGARDLASPVVTVPAEHEAFYDPHPTPLVPVRLTAGRGPHIYTWALLDSGADRSVLGLDFIAQLGIAPAEVTTGQKLADIGICAGHRVLEPKPTAPLVECQVGGFDFEFPLQFWFSPTPLPWMLLGREGVLKQFTWTFDHAGFELAPHPTGVRSPAPTDKPTPAKVTHLIP